MATLVVFLVNLVLIFMSQSQSPCGRTNKEQDFSISIIFKVCVFEGQGFRGLYFLD